MYEEQKTENKSLVIPGFPCETMVLPATQDRVSGKLKAGEVVKFDDEEGNFYKVNDVNGLPWTRFKGKVYVVARDYDESVENAVPVVFVNAKLDLDVFLKINNRSDVDKSTFLHYCGMTFVESGVFFEDTI